MHVVLVWHAVLGLNTTSSQEEQQKDGWYVFHSQSANGGDHPARAVDSTQVKTADRGLGVHVRPAWA